MLDLLPKVETVQVGQNFLNCGEQKKYPLNARAQPMYASHPDRIRLDAAEVVQVAKFYDQECGFDMAKELEDRFASLIKPLVVQEFEQAQAAAKDQQLQEQLKPQATAIEAATEEAANTATTEDVEMKTEEDQNATELKAKEKTVEELENEAKDMEKKLDLLIESRKLDLFVLYLHHVHYYDYYTGIESTSPQDHLRKGGLPIRKPLLEQHATKQAQHDKKQHIRNRVTTHTLQDSEMTVLGFKELEHQTNIVCSMYIRKEGESKYRCTDCQKLFRGDEFVRKHIKSKHFKLVEHVDEEVKFFNAYCADSARVEVKSVKREREQRDRYNDQRPIPRDSRDSFGERGSYGDRRYARPSEGRRDSRQVKSYHDLDAPVHGDVQLSYD
jgi:hypothetical protein